MAESNFDLVVIGAGPGGYVAAVRAARLGMRVACVEQGPLGGVCLNVGCIPSKALLESSELYHQIRRGAAVHGVQVEGVGLDLAAMMARKERIVRTMGQGIATLFRQHRVEHLAGRARLAGSGRVQVQGEGGERTVQAGRVLLATGSAPIELPGLPFDGEHILSSTEALSLSRVPERLVVVGGGAIGLELGSVWSRLGARVLIVEFLDHILPGTDREMGGQLQRLLGRQGLEFRLQTTARAARVESGEVQLQLACGDEVWTEACDRVLVAVGRRPGTGDLGLEEAGVALDQKGRVVVDQNFQTSAAGVYAIGDLVAGPMLAHKAEEEGMAAVERMAGRAGQVNYQAIPSVVYTHPELASVGLSEEAAREQGLEIKTGKYLFRANGRAHCMEAIDGQVKVLSEAGTDRLLGVHVLGAQASHLIAEAVVALEFGASAEDLARSVHAHPTLSEVVKEAAWATQE